MDIEHAAAPVSPQEATFRKALRDAEPWSLDAQQLSTWLEEHWVNSDSKPGAFREIKRRRELVEKLKPDKQTVDEVMGDKDLLAGFDDPEVMRAVDDVAKNPRNIAKYADNPKVLAFYSKMAGMVGNRLEKMGDNSQSGR